MLDTLMVLFVTNSTFLSAVTHRADLKFSLYCHPDQTVFIDEPLQKAEEAEEDTVRLEINFKANSAHSAKTDLIAFFSSFSPF